MCRFEKQSGQISDICIDPSNSNNFAVVSVTGDCLIYDVRSPVAAHSFGNKSFSPIRIFSVS